MGSVMGRTPALDYNPFMPGAMNDSSPSLHGHQFDAEPDQSQESPQIPDAEQKLTFARNNLKMAQKGILGYSQIVAICRGVISDYPDTPYAQQAQELLRQVPQNQRSQFNLTDEELGTE